MYGPRGSITNNELPWITQMAQPPESLNMDHRNITFFKKRQITISKNLAILILFGVISALILLPLITHFITKQKTNQRCADRISHLEFHDKTKFTTNQNPSTTTTTIESTTKLITTVTPPSVTTTPSKNVTKIKYLRLPTSVVPIDYDIKILTIMTNFTFFGEEIIQINVTEATNNVTLHIYNLTVNCENVLVQKQNEEDNVKVANCSNDKLLQFFILHFTDLLETGIYNISLKFNGELRDELAGYYKSSYSTLDNNETWLAATQFEPTDARSAFPCFDEPAMKATFKITIGRPNDLNAISNMPLVSSTPHPELSNYTWDEFQRSLPMSTYLVAFVVSDFQPRKLGNFSLYARASAFNQTEMAASLGPKVLSFFEKFFDVPFPLPKMDMAAIPDFSAGAMENWGLITYRESNLLYEEGVSTKRNLKRISIVVAHELGHQWFGNLVTPSWWTDLWLNEGFASYLEYIATDDIYPEWKIMDQFVVDDLQTVFSLDALKSSHPISIVVHNPNEINDIFDRISYAKGATIIRMMDDFLTTTSFRRGLTKYLNEKKYKNAQQDDLWTALTLQAQRDEVFDRTLTVKEIMDTWTLQMGYPLVTVNRTFRPNEVTITQAKFTLNRNFTDFETAKKYSWWVPITYRTKGYAEPRRTWLRKGSKSLTLSIKLTEQEWFLLNLNQTGYYRVNYDPLGWELLTKQLEEDHKIIDPKNRAQILNDALSLASAGYLGYETALNITIYLQNEDEYVPWVAALSNLDYIQNMFQRSGYFDKFKAYMSKLLMPMYKKLGFNDSQKDPLLMTFLREIIIGRACNLGLPECVQWAHTEFSNWMLSANPDMINSISPDLKSIIYCTAVEAGGEKSWNFVWHRFLNANVGTERELLLQALGCTKEPWLLNKYMTMAITQDSGIKKQDVPLVFRAVGKNIIGQTIGMRFVLSKWTEINKFLGKSITTTNGIINAVTNNLNTKKELEELKTFAQKNSKDETFSQRNVNQIIEQTQANIDWMEKYFPAILLWLNTYQQEKEMQT